MHRPSIARLLAPVALALLLIALLAGPACADAGPSAAPPPPQGVFADKGIDYDLIRVACWTEAGGTYFEVYRATTAGGAAPYLGIAYPDGTGYADLNDWSGNQLQHYFYYVKACTSGDGCGALSSAYAEGWVKTVATPSKPQASDGASSQYVDVEWTAAAGADRYELYRRVAGQGSLSLLQLVYDTEYRDASAVKGIQYDYAIKGCRSNGCGNISQSDTGWAKLGPPDFCSASDGTYANKVRVSWPVVANATSYAVYRGGNSQGYSEQWTGIPSNGYDDTSAVPGEPYYYWVSACNSLGCSNLTGSDTGYRGELPPAPTAIQASDGDHALWVRVTWNATEGSASYEIWRAVNSGGYAFLVDGVSATQYDDNDTTSGNVYWYKVRGCGSLGCGEFGSPDSGYPMAPPPAPGNVQASDASFTDRVRITWSPASNATAYQIHRGTSPEQGSSTQVGSTGGTSYDDLSATPGTLYFYWVSASNSAGPGAWGGPDMGKAAEVNTATPAPTNTSSPTHTPTHTATSTATSTRRPSLTPSNTARPWPTATNTRRPKSTATATNTRPARPSSTPTSRPLRPTTTGAAPSPTWPDNPDTLLMLPLVLR